MRIRTLAGPPLDHEVVRDVLRAMCLVEALRSPSSSRDAVNVGDVGTGPYHRPTG